MAIAKNKFLTTTNHMKIAVVLYQIYQKNSVHSFTDILFDYRSALDTIFLWIYFEHSIHVLLSPCLTMSFGLVMIGECVVKRRKKFKFMCKIFYFENVKLEMSYRGKKNKRESALF